MSRLRYHGRSGTNNALLEFDVTINSGGRPCYLLAGLNTP